MTYSERLKHGCWGCKYRQKGGMTFFGFCLYFEEMGEEKKEITAKVADNGCKYRDEG